MPVRTIHDEVPRMNPSRLDRRTTYWRRVCLWTALGLAVWFGVTFGVSWWSQVLDEWRIGQMPAGYWWATQGAIGVYLLIIVVHGWQMDRMEREALRGDDPDA
jgi:putative solute:sodium symporter small subunit